MNIRTKSAYQACRWQPQGTLLDAGLSEAPDADVPTVARVLALAERVLLKVTMKKCRYAVSRFAKTAGR
jgi:hypothetical protein